MRLVQQYSMYQQVYYMKLLTPLFTKTRDVCQYRHRYVNDKG